MTLNRWDPFRDRLSFQEKITRLMAGRENVAVARNKASWRPAFDSIETAEAFIVRGDLPGVGKESIDIEVEGRRVVVRGERLPDRDPEGAAYHALEREAGVFQRIFVLPKDVNSEQTSAVYKDGVLTLTLPKTTVTGSRRTVRPRF